MPADLIVDTHVHPISDDPQRYPLRRREGAATTAPPAEGRRAGEGGMVEKALTLEAMLAAMDRAGVQRTILVQSAGLYGFDNSYIADSAAAHPGRCLALCAIDVLAADAPDVLSYWVSERGMHGIRLTSADELDNPATYPVWERARALGVPVDVQMQPRHLDKLTVVLQRFPDVPVVIDHAANVNRRQPDGTVPHEPPEALLALSSLANLYVKLTSQNVDSAIETGEAPAVFFGPLLRRFGAERLLWGTDSPATADQPYELRYEQSRQAFAFMTDTEQRLVFGETAQKLWPALAG